MVFHEQGKIIDANPAILTIFGVSDSKGIHRQEHTGFYRS